MKVKTLLKAFNTFFAIIGIFFISVLLFIYLSNGPGLTTLLSVMGLVETESLYEIDASQLFTGASRGVVDALNDPYSKYLSKDSYEELQLRLNAEFGGIGVYVLQDAEGSLKIISPIKGTPAYKEGLKHGDIIIRINGDSTINMTQDEAVALMRGDPGTQLELGVYRESDGKEYDFQIIREIINVPSVEDQVIEDNPEIGYIRLNQFHAHSAGEMVDSVNRLINEDKIKGLILDLRNNGGGEFGASISVASIFLDGEEVVSEVDAKGNKTVHRASSGKIDLPLVVLVNQDSASAAEILAGALQDNKRALLLGQKTFGKGLVQTLYPLPDGGALKLTTRKYFTPEGTDINEIGIYPDYEVENDPESSMDLQLEKAREMLKEQIF